MKIKEIILEIKSLDVDKIIRIGTRKMNNVVNDKSTTDTEEQKIKKLIRTLKREFSSDTIAKMQSVSNENDNPDKMLATILLGLVATSTKSFDIKAVKDKMNKKKDGMKDETADISDSSWITKAEYKPKQKDMTLYTDENRRIDIHGVDKTKFDTLKKAQSKGKYWHSDLKPPFHSVN